jgi:hypothetical protein
MILVEEKTGTWRETSPTASLYTTNHTIIPKACLWQINFLHCRVDYSILFVSSVCVYTRTKCQAL